METITLLLALKVKLVLSVTKVSHEGTPCIDAALHFIMILQIEYPENVHLIRGNHEAADINALFGFRIECVERMVWIKDNAKHKLNIFTL